ncbi:hypothetical protein [Dyella jiangningensis]
MEIMSVAGEEPTAMMPCTSPQGVAMRISARVAIKAIALTQTQAAGHIEPVADPASLTGR